MIDPDGVEWLPAALAAHRAGVEDVTIRVWKRRGKVRGHVIGRKLWVAMPDVLDAERKTRGRYARQRGEQLTHCAPGTPVPAVEVQ